MADQKPNLNRTPDGFIEDFNPIDIPAFPPTDEEMARAEMYAKAKALGRLNEPPFTNWNPDGTLKNGASG